MLLAVYAWIWILVASAAATLIRADVVAVLAAIPVLWVALVLQVKRLHDMNISGWHAVWIWALAVAAGEAGGMAAVALRSAGCGLLALLCLTPGSPGPNRFGVAPMA